MTQKHSPELVQVLTQYGEEVDHLKRPDLRTLPLAFDAERERNRSDIANVARQMHEQRTAAITHFTQLLLCARSDLPLRSTPYFNEPNQRKELIHE